MGEKNFSIAETFNLPDIPANITVKGCDEPNEFVPKIDPDYVFRKDLLSDILAWHMMDSENEGFWLAGPTGSGKTSLRQQVAARINKPVITVNAHSRLESPDLIGHYALVNGSMQYVDGPLTTAMQNGWWFAIDEIDYLDPATAAGLNAVAEGYPLVIPEKNGEVVHRAKGFGFLVSGNTTGSGDETGMYQGTLRQNMAFVDRFWMSIVDYPEEAHELDIMKKAVPEIPEDIHKTMIAYADKVRKQFVAGQIEITMSTRTLVKWAKMANFFRPLKAKGINPIHHALDRALAFKATLETANALREIAQREFGD